MNQPNPDNRSVILTGSDLSQIGAIRLDQTEPGQGNPAGISPTGPPPLVGPDGQGIVVWENCKVNPAGILPTQPF